jgi:hypothetical protein
MAKIAPALHSKLRFCFSSVQTVVAPRPALRQRLARRRDLADVGVGLLLIAHIKVTAERAHALPRLHLELFQILDEISSDDRNRLALQKAVVRRRAQIDRVSIR